MAAAMPQQAFPPGISRPPLLACCIHLSACVCTPPFGLWFGVAALIG
jgi:hypothetical protein